MDEGKRGWVERSETNRQRWVDQVRRAEGEFEEWSMHGPAPEPKINY